MVMQRLNTGTTGKVFKMILLGVLFAAVAGLVLTDVGGFFRQGVGRQDVARIGHKSIGLNAFAQSYRQALQQNNMTEEAARQMGAPYMFLQQEVGREVLLQAAQKAGIRISDKYIGNELKTQLDSVKQPGTAQEKLAMLLQQKGITEKMFVDLIRGDYAINLLTNAPVSSDMTAPAALVTAIYAADKEKRVAQIVKITPALIKGENALNDGAIKAFYDENKDRYKTQETRDIAFVVLPKSLFSADVSVKDAEIEAYYNEHKTEFMNPERVRFEQVIVDNEKVADKIASSKSALSEAKGDKTQFVANDWYTKTTLPKELQKAIYPAKPKGLIGPIQTSLGWHVIKVDSYEEAKPKALAEVKETLQRQLKDEKLDAQISNFSEHLDSLVSSGQGLDAIAEEYKVKPQTVDNMSAVNAAAKLKSTNLPEDIIARVKDSSFALDDGEISPLIDMPNGDYALLQVTKIDAATVPALDKIKNQVTADAQKANQSKALIAYAEKVIGAYDTRKPESFLQAVEKNGLKAETTGSLTRAEAEKSLDKSNASLLFSLTQGNRLSFTNSPDQATLIFLKDIVPTTEKPSEKDMVDLKKKIGETLSQEMHQQFMQAWQDDIGVTINEPLVKAQFVDVQTK